MNRLCKKRLGDIRDTQKCLKRIFFIQPNIYITCSFFFNSPWFSRPDDMVGITGVIIQSVMQWSNTSPAMGLHLPAMGLHFHCNGVTSPLQWSYISPTMKLSSPCGPCVEINIWSCIATIFPRLFRTCSKISPDFFKAHDLIRTSYTLIRSNYDQLRIITLYGRCHTIWQKSKIVTRAWTGVMEAHPIYTGRATSPQWLQMSWRQIGVRPSATTMLTWLWLYCHLSNVQQRSRG